ncbi:MAG: pantetheine-phosphate adenylyltransferase [Clostridia bacterium]|nr:pantetheine-phosphate adenylyltransferase [Clostridia bacterium]
MKKALITGSFDPITTGHLDIITRAAGLFDAVYVVAFENAEKKCMFSPEKRLRLMEKACSGIKNVITDYYDGYVVDYMKIHGIDVIVRGIRNPGDAEYELMMAKNNRKLYEKAGTVFLPASDGFEKISSTAVREAIGRGEPSPFCPWLDEIR